MGAGVLDDLGARVLRYAPGVVVVFDLEKLIRYINPYFERLTGYALDDVRGKPWIETFVPERNRAEAHERFARGVHGIPPRRDVHPIVTRNGDERQIEWLDAFLEDDLAGVPALVAIGQDVTERIAVEIRHRSLLAALHDGIVVQSADGQVTECNPTAERLLAGAIDPATPGRFISPDDRLFLPDGTPLPWEAHPTVVALRTGRATEDVVMGVQDGSAHARWLSVRAGPIRGPEGVGIVGVVTTIADVTAREEALAKRETSDARLREAQRSAGVGSWERNAALGTNWWSDEIYRVLGLDPAVTVPSYERYLAAIHPDDRPAATEACERSVTTGEGYDQRYRIVRPDGSIRHVRMLAQPIAQQNGVQVLAGGTLQDVTALVDAEERVRASEQRYRRLFDDAVEAMFRTLIDGTILDVNPAFARLFRFDSPEALLGTNVKALYVNPHDRDALRGRVAIGQSLTDFRVRARRQDGDVIVIEISLRHLQDDHGVEQYQGFVRDVTAHVQMEEAQRALTTGLAHLSGSALFSEVARMLADIVGASVGFVGTLRHGTDGTVRTQALVVDGVVAEPMTYGLVDVPIAGIDSTAVAFPEGARRVCPEPRVFTELGVNAYGAASLLDSKQQFVGHVGVMSRRPWRHPERVASIVHLFAMRVAAEVERVRSEARFVSVFEHSPDAVLITDGTGRVVLANRMAATILGYTQSELLLVPVATVVPELALETLAALAERAMGTDAALVTLGAGCGRVWAFRKDGVKVPVEINLSPLQSDDGTMVVAVIRDITVRVRAEEERLRLEEHLRQSQKMESLGTLAGGIAHDFNNLLGAILANVDFAREAIPPGHAAEEPLWEVSTAATRATELVKQILAFSQRRPRLREVTAVQGVVTEAVRLLRATLPAGIQIVCDTAPGIPAVRMDPTQIHQVLMNLGTNAWHAIEGATGTLTFRSDTVDITPDAPPCVGMEPGKYVRVCVTDDGRGMDKETQERIFEPFFTTKGPGKGTGLGLSVVHGIIGNYGGGITVESAEGVGTTITVYLPATDEVVPPVARIVTPQPRAPGTVMLIDDEAALARVSGRLIERLGYSVVVYARGRDAVAAMREHPHRFDVVVTDQNMPEMNGIEVARAIREIRKDLPIVLISGNHMHTPEELAAAGIDHALDKPFTRAELGAVLGRALQPG